MPLLIDVPQFGRNCSRGILFKGNCGSATKAQQIEGRAEKPQLNLRIMNICRGYSRTNSKLFVMYAGQKEPFDHLLFFPLLVDHIADNVVENFYGLPLYMHIILLPTYYEHNYTWLRPSLPPESLNTRFGFPKDRPHYFCASFEKDNRKKKFTTNFRTFDFCTAQEKKCAKLWFKLKMITNKGNRLLNILH